MRTEAADPYERVEAFADRLERRAMSGLASDRAIALMWAALALWGGLSAVVLVLGTVASGR